MCCVVLWCGVVMFDDGMEVIYCRYGNYAGMEMTQVKHFTPDANMDKIRPMLISHLLAQLNNPPHIYTAT